MAEIKNGTKWPFQRCVPAQTGEHLRNPAVGANGFRECAQTALSGEHFPSMPKRHADVLEILIAQMAEYRDIVAELIDTTRSRVSFFMNKFRRLGLIDYNGHMEVHSSLLNVVLHEDPHINR